MSVRFCLSYDILNAIFVAIKVCFFPKKICIVLTDGVMTLPHNIISGTPDWDFRCFYPCEIVLSHRPMHTKIQ